MDFVLDVLAVVDLASTQGKAIALIPGNYSAVVPPFFRSDHNSKQWKMTWLEMESEHALDEKRGF